MTGLARLALLLALAGPGCQVSDDDDDAVSDDDDTAGDDDDSGGPTGELVAISCGAVSVCVLDDDGVAHCIYGDSSDWVRLPLVPVVEVVASSQAACTVDPGGLIDCWGAGGQLLDTEIPAIPYFSLSGSCALRVGTGELDCWSGSGGGYLGEDPPSTQMLKGGGYACLRNAQSVRCISLDGISVQLDGAFTDMSGSEYPDQTFVCGLDSGFISCEGSTEQPSSGGWAGISGIGPTSCANHTDGTVACWGRSDPSSAPITPMRQICDSVTNAWFCGITLDNQVGCWGSVPDNLSQFEVP